MIKCETCAYYVNDKNNENFCAYYCEFIDRIILLSMCKWLEKEK